MTTNDVLIRVEDLEKSFGKVDVLKGVNAEIKKGDVMVVIGPSGSGKSTFLRCLNRLEEPTGGHIYFNDVTIHKRNQQYDYLAYFRLSLSQRIYGLICTYSQPCYSGRYS